MATHGSNTSRLPLLLLIGQAFCFGAAMFTAYTASSALFLVDYSAWIMPYINITTGLVMVGTSLGFDQLQKRWPLTRVALIVVTGLAVLYLASWLGYLWHLGRWLSFGGMVLYQLLVMFGWIVLSVQAGQLFHVREIKRLLPFVVAAQSLASPLGSLLLPLLMAVLGRIDNLLLITCGALLCFLLLLVVTSRRFASALAQTKRPAGRRSTVSLTQLLQKRYIGLVFAYFTLMFVTTQLVRFVQLNQTSIHYTTPAALTAFFSNLFGVTVFAGLLFSLFVVGRLLTRLGMRVGLTTHPGLLIVLLVFGLAVGVFAGPTSSAFL